MPWRAKMRWACLPISPSRPGSTRSRNSTTVTCAPSRRHTEPSSRPITPAPTTISRCGTWASDSAPVELTTRSSSISTPLSGATSEPVAMTIALASTMCSAPSSPATRTLPGPAMLPVPLEGVDLVLLEQEGDAGGVRLHHAVLVAHHGREVELRRADLDAEALESVAGQLEHLGDVQQRLGRDAADVQAGAAEGRHLLDDRHLEAELGGLDGCRRSRRGRCR